MGDRRDRDRRRPDESPAVRAGPWAAFERAAFDTCEPGESPAVRAGPWAALERAAFDTCEPDVTGWLTHPGETVSALAYFVAAAVLRRASRACPEGSPARHLPAILCLLGAAALSFHASFAAVFQRLDLAAIPLLTGPLLASALVRSGHAAPERRRALRLAFAGGGAVAPFVLTALGYAVVTLQAACLLWLWRSLARRTPAIRGDLRAVAVLLLPAAALLGLGHAGVACASAGSAWAHVVQPHIAWHLASAAACVFAGRVECALEDAPA